MQVLFINACVRGTHVSRTYHIAKSFLNEVSALHPDWIVTERNLSDLMPAYLHRGNFDEHDAKIFAGHIDDPSFASAREFASADRIVIAAPFWEFAFPAILSTYLETVSVTGITFRYEDDHSVGLCQASRMLYITTRGGDFTSPSCTDLKLGEKMLRNLSTLYGIPRFDVLSADGLDLFGANVEQLVDQAIVAGKTLAQTF